MYTFERRTNRRNVNAVYLNGEFIGLIRIVRTRFNQRTFKAITTNGITIQGSFRFCIDLLR